MPKFIMLDSNETVIDRLGFDRIDAQALLTVDELSDESLA